jgi:hypothetical protein
MIWNVIRLLCEIVFRTTIKAITKVFVKDISKHTLLPIFTEKDVTAKEGEKKVSPSGNII